MIILAGDTHADHDYRKLSNEKVISQFGRLPDFLIELGDFGVPWSNNPDDRRDLYMKRWYESKPYDIIIIPGNHENYDRIEALPVELYHGALVHRFGRNIVFVKKNQILTLENKTFYCFGGADSTDKEFRTLGTSWWPQEQATYADFLEMQEVLKKIKKVDYICTHTCPTFITKKLYREDRFNCSTSRVLDYLVDNIDFKEHFFGHMHEDISFTINDKKYNCLYNKLKEI